METDLIYIFVLLALATLVSEDLTCIGAGVMVAEGKIGFGFAVLACLAGIVIGDILLFLLGRLIGRAVVHRAPLRWFVREVDVERGTAWFQHRGMLVIAISRFMPGTRLPTYVAAGLLDTSLLKFSLYFLAAAAIWTPLLVGGSLLVGREVIESALFGQQSLLLRVSIAGLTVYVIVRLLLQLSSYRGRRLLFGRWLRLTHWEFWPPGLFYPPVVFYICYLGLKHRCLTLFTSANPAIEEGGFVGESKSRILNGLGREETSRQFIPATALLRGSFDTETKLAQVRQFLTSNDCEFPIVLKPDRGERGAGVSVVRTQDEVRHYLERSPDVDLIIQEHITGSEFGVFYYRYPDETSGRIFAITRKLFPVVIGDGVSTLENLILSDRRAPSMARAYFDAQRDRLLTVPEAGEAIQLIEIGTHCRGSIFLDGAGLKTDELEIAIDRLARGFKGFYFGRFDIRTPSVADFLAGREFKVVELNGVTSEATNIYDPKNSLSTAYRILFKQWRIAFEIGAQNRKRGAQLASVKQLASLVLKKWQANCERSRSDLRLNGQEVLNN